MKTASSLFTLKDYDNDLREVRGIASTPETDRMGDVVVSEGIQYETPLPFLLGHDQAQPIGSVTSVKATPRGLEIVARLAKIAEPGALRDRLDSAWGSLKAGLIRGLSIGFRGLETEPIATGLRFTKWELLEVSAVVVPANASSGIESVRQFGAHAAHYDPRHPGAVYLRPLRRATAEESRRSRLAREHPGSVSIAKSSPSLDGAVWLDEAARVRHLKARYPGAAILPRGPRRK